MATKTITVSDADVEVWDAAASARGGGSADGLRSVVARDLLALLDGGAESAPGTLEEVHAALLSLVPRSHKFAALVLAERVEGIVRRLDPGRAAALTEARQAQAGGAA